MSAVIDVVQLSKTHGEGPTRVQALRDVTFAIEEGEMVAIMGPSGSGKSTLMYILGCLDRPTCGSYRLLGQDTRVLADDALARLRNQHIGFVFQSYQLLATLDAVSNVELPLLYRGMPRHLRRQRAIRALQEVGLGDRLFHRPTQLSGGQQQRVAIARALVGQPALLLADEPTGNLDSHSGSEILRLFYELRDGGKTVVVVTHSPEVAAACQRTITIRDGQIQAEEVGPR